MAVPPLRIDEPVLKGVSNANDAPLLCGDWLCGGPLDIQAASSSRSGQPVSVAGPSVGRVFRAWARAPLRLHFVSARPLLISVGFWPKSDSTLVISSFSAVTPYNWREDISSLRNVAQLCNPQSYSAAPVAGGADCICHDWSDAGARRGTGRSRQHSSRRLARNMRKIAPIRSQSLMTTISQCDAAGGEPPHGSSGLRYVMGGGDKDFRVAAPDVTCSSAFSPNAKSLLSSQYAQMELPPDVLPKIMGQRRSRATR